MNYNFIRTSHPDDQKRLELRSKLALGTLTILDEIADVQDTLNFAINTENVLSLIDKILHLNTSLGVYRNQYEEYARLRYQCLGHDKDDKAFFEDERLMQQMRNLITQMKKQFTESRKIMAGNLTYEGFCKLFEGALTSVENHFDSVESIVTKLINFVNRKDIKRSEAAAALHSHFERSISVYSLLSEADISKIRETCMDNDSVVPGKCLKTITCCDVMAAILPNRTKRRNLLTFTGTSRSIENYMPSRFFDLMKKVLHSSEQSCSESDFALRLLHLNADNEDFDMAFQAIYQHAISTDPIRAGRKTFWDVFSGDFSKLKEIVESAAKYILNCQFNLSELPEKTIPNTRGRKANSVKERMDRYTDFLIALFYCLLGCNLFTCLKQGWNAILCRCEANMIEAYSTVKNRIETYREKDWSNASTIFKKCLFKLKCWFSTNFTEYYALS